MRIFPRQAAPFNIHIAITTSEPSRHLFKRATTPPHTHKAVPEQEDIMSDEISQAQKE